MPEDLLQNPALTADTRSRLYCTSHSAMATEYSLYLCANSREDADAIGQHVFDEVDRVEELLSNYRESSELCRINREAAVSEVTTDPETFHFLETCLAWSEKSSGAFDITVGRLMKAWGFFGAKGAIPFEEKLAETRAQVGWQNVRLDAARRTVRFQSSGIELDPGGVGKGYAVDRAVKILRQRQVPAALLSAGSSTIYALGAPPGETGWKIQVPSVDKRENTISTVILRDSSLSTANRSEKNFTHNGHFYGAIMDPRTLAPAEGVLQVTVISPSATESDILSNASFILNPHDRASFMDELPQAAALVISENQPSPDYVAIRWPAAIDSALRAGPETAKGEQEL